MTKRPNRGKRGKGGSAGKGGRLSKSPPSFKSVGKNSGGQIAGARFSTGEVETKKKRKARERAERAGGG